MKQSYRFLFVAFMLMGILLSACGAAATPGAQKVAADIIFTGTLESMEGTQWVVNGQTITVDPAVIKDGPFIVGDFVKVEGVIQPDGAFVVTRIETPTADDLSIATDPAVDNSNANTNDANSNDAITNTNDANSNDDHSNDDNSNAANTNDDDNGNDDNSNASNTNDDNGNDNSSNDDDSNDNSSGDDNRDDGNDNSNGDDNSDGDNSGDDNSNNS